MESEQLLLSVGLGIGIGLGYLAASYFSNRRAMRSSRNFMLLVVSTMMLRLLAALVLIIAIVLTLPVLPAAFLGSFFVIFAIGLAAEIWSFHRRQSDEAETPARSDLRLKPE